jgi:hypothetical protein
MANKAHITNADLDRHWELLQRRARVALHCVILPLCAEIAVAEGIFKGPFPNAPLRGKITVFTVMSANIAALALYFWHTRNKTLKDGE